jgi:hypothetical protein
MNRCTAPALVVCALVGALNLSAQDSQNSYVPLTLEQSYLFSLNKVVGGGGIALVAFKSAFDQLRDAPAQWGTEADSFATRAAWHFGRSLIRQNIAFGVRALDGEDPRYFVSGHGTKWERTKYAVEHTFVVHNSSGGWMPAYSLFLSSYATPFAVNDWRPVPRTVPHEIGAGSAGVGIAVVSSVFQEFWPDLKKDLKKKLRRDR